MNVLKIGNMQEIWKDIKGYEGLYQVSNLGRVKNIKRNIVNKATKDNSGYLLIGLSKDNVQKKYLVHRLVAKTFIPNPKNKRTVNHKDFNKHNNNVNNLEWMTDSENTQHAYDNDMIKRNFKYSKQKAEQIKQEFELSDITEWQLSKKYNISYRTIKTMIHKQYGN